jgi:Copper transport outer membrane protein, MctB
VISLRYHVVTIVAIFLALAIGLLAGGAFVQPALQEELQNRTDAAESRAEELRGEIDDLHTEISGLGAFADAVTPMLTDGKLSGTPVVVVTQTGVEDGVLSEVQSALASAGARVLTTVSATEELVSKDPATQEQLATIVGEPTASADELPTLAAQALAQGLSPSTSVVGGDVLDQLLSAGFLAPIGPGPSQATLDEIGQPGQVVVVLSGGRGDNEPTLPPEDFAVPLVTRLAGLSVPVAAGESLLSDYPYVSLVRDAGTDGTVTVDDLDRTMGGAALVLGLEDLIATGAGGDYGVKDGADPLPPFA